MSQNIEDAIFGDGKTSRSDYPNPFQNVPAQYMPRDMDEVLHWANIIFLKFDFYRSALSRVVSYFITNLQIECDNEKDKKEYKKAFEDLNWKTHSLTAVINLLGYGNSYTVFNQGFNKFLKCPECAKISLIDRINNYTFHKGKYNYKCLKCGYHGIHEVIDKPINDLTKMSLKHLPIDEVVIQYEESMDYYEYYWDLPDSYIEQIKQKNNKFYSKKTPSLVIDSVFERVMKLIKFKDSNFLHLKLPTPVGIKTGGRGFPLCMYMFDSFFMLKVLEKFNEVICYEDINPFRVIAMSSGNDPAANSILHQDADLWSAAVDDMVKNHRRDPASYHKFPFKLAYEQLGGQGKALAPVELMSWLQTNILSGLNIPQELYNMNFQFDNAGPALRLFENSWSIIPDAISTFLNKWGKVISKVKGLKEAKISVMAVTIADNMEKKSIIQSLASSNAISITELLNLYDLNFEDQLRKKQEEDRVRKQVDEEEKARTQLEQSAENSIFGQEGGQGSTPGQLMEDYQAKAQALIGLPPAQIREELQQIKATDEQAYAQIKSIMDQMRAEARSQGNEQLKQGQ